jgi:hypothetical protein
LSPADSASGSTSSSAGVTVIIGALSETIDLRLITGTAGLANLLRMLDSPRGRDLGMTTLDGRGALRTLGEAAGRVSASSSDAAADLLAFLVTFAVG